MGKGASGYTVSSCIIKYGYTDTKGILSQKVKLLNISN